MSQAKVTSYWGALVLAEIFSLIFLTGFLPRSWLTLVDPVLFSALYLTTAMGLEKNRKAMVRMAATLLVAQVIFKLFNLEVIEASSKILNIAFFCVIIGFLIYQISSAGEVTRTVIFEAINGYLLLGLVFSFLTALMLQVDPASFNIPAQDQGNFHESIYFGFVTFATLGYGDLLPLKPHAKSLSVLIAICGQLYVAVIIALLVGKFSSQSRRV